MCGGGSSAQASRVRNCARSRLAFGQIGSSTLSSEHPGRRNNPPFSHAFATPSPVPTQTNGDDDSGSIRRVREVGRCEHPSAGHSPSRRAARSSARRTLDWQRVRRAARGVVLACCRTPTTRSAFPPIRLALEDAILERAASHPVSARNELQALKAVLRYAQACGHGFESSLLAIEPVATPKHEGRALCAEELEFMAAYAPSYAFRLVLLAGTTGNRIAELFTLTDDRVDLAGRTLTIRPASVRERRTKVVPLTDEETSLLREQLLARAPETSLVFPKR
jgi:integrase